MCGIAGVVYAPPVRVNDDLARDMLDGLAHRGPDDRGVLRFCKGRVWSGRDWHNGEAEAALFHTRLSILDLSESGWQPMSTPDGRYHIVLNGEIYNYLELRQELDAVGYRFVSSSDTEVLLAAYAHWGSEALTRLVGMFAFAILDTHERKLFLARDFFGIKPLYYAFGRNGFAFASEVKSLLTFPWVGRAANPARLYDYLRYNLTDHGADTLLTDVHQLPAAHYLCVSLDAPADVEPVRYWKLDVDPRADLSFEEAAEQLRAHFLDSVRLHLRSDVPVGAALSGGIDSSSIVTAMRRLYGYGLDIHTFSYIVDDPLIGEERWVDMVGQASGVTVHKVRWSASELVADLDDLIVVQGEPFGGTSIYAQQRVFQLAKQAGIKVMLDGQGADEMLGGYSIYTAARFASLIRQGKVGQALRFLHKSSASHWPDGRRTWLQAGQFLIPPGLQGPFRHLTRQDLMPFWLNARWFGERGVSPLPVRCPGGAEMMREELIQTLTKTNLPELLRVEDRNSMANSIESRVPFLTPKLVEFVMALPEDYIISPEGVSKSVFRQAMRGIVPQPILDRRDKIGFATPERDLLVALRPWVEQTLQKGAAQRIPAVRHHVMQDDWEAIVSGKKTFDNRFWRWLILIQWVDRFDIVFT